MLLASLIILSAASQDLRPNTWMDAAVQYQLPAGVSDAKWVTTDGYCGSVRRSRTGGILIRTGIRSKEAGYSPGFYSNTTLEWDLKKNTARVIDIARWGGGSYGGGQLLAGFSERPSPSPRHTYDGIAYVESEEALYLMLGANWRIGSRNATDEAKRQLETDNLSTWKYVFGENRWRRMDQNVRGFWKISPYESHLRYWPEGMKLLFLNDNGNRYAEFDLETQRWREEKTANKPPMSFYNARSAWDDKRGLWILRLGPEVCTFDPRTRSFTKLPPAYPVPENEKDPRRRWKGVVYIPRHDAYLITGPSGNDTWVYSVKSGKWERVGASDIELPNGYPQYDPSLDLVVLVYQLKAFKLRYIPDR